ncbi:MAG: hypothetical protein Q9225_007662 [Loekoesia sp. 1 TL-2023]
MPSEAGNRVDPDAAEPSDCITNASENFDGSDVRIPTIAPSHISTDSAKPLEYATETKEFKYRSFVTVSTASSISADTVASLGGEERAKTFVESVTARFAEKFSDELERQLRDACKNTTSQENAISYTDEAVLEVRNSSKPTREVYRKPGYGLKVHKEDHGSNREPEAVNATKGRRLSVTRSSMYLEEYSGPDSSTHSADRSHEDSEDSENVSEKGSDDDSQEKRLISSFDQDARESSEERSSIYSDSSRSEVATEDLKVVLQRLDEIESARHDGRESVAYDPINRPSIQNPELAPNSRLDIGSDLILDVLKQVPLDEKAMLGSTASISWPNDDVFRYRERIGELALCKGELAVTHVDVLLELVGKDYAARINNIEKMFPRGTSNFQILREIFWKGDIVVNKQGTRAYRVVDAFFDVDERGPKPRRFLAVNAVYVDFQGDRFGTVKHHCRILECSGVKYIKDLPILPLKYHSNAEKLAQRLLERGQKFACLSGQNYKIHRGSVPKHELPDDRRGRRFYLPRSHSSRDDSDSDSNSSVSLVEDENATPQTDARVVVDAAAFNRHEPLREIETRSLKKELVHGVLTEEHLRICTNEVPVFSMRDKIFYKAPVDEIHDVVFSEQVFAQLVIPESTKSLIQALVENHAKGTGVDDFVEGKGKGLIILLHGPPGVGKTMTAEAVAEHAKRPLYAVTSGELGETSRDLEDNLRKILDRAKTFRTVLLLDEADVFVEERRPQDLQRNALVSIFLRELEYYQGILILTTNRAQTFDHAFQSRIHLSIEYSELDTRARERIWRAFGDRIVGGFRISDADYDELAAWKLNGRQIKNAVSSSKALASSKGEEISMDHLRIVLRIGGNSQSWA